MNIDQIITFLGVYHAGSYQKAAEQMYLPQSTISNRIKMMELDLNKLLFIRNKTGIQLTEEGHTFLPYAQRVITTLEEGRQAVEQLHRVQSGKLTVGCNNSFTSALLPYVLANFKTDYPDVSIQVMGCSTREQIRKINYNELRLGVSRYALNIPSLTFINIFQEDVKLIVSKNHPLARRKLVTIEQITAEPFISYELDTLYRKTLEVTFGHLNVAHEIKYESNNLPLLKHWIKEGCGVFLSGGLLFREELLHKQVVSIPIESNPFPFDNVFLVYKKGNLNSLDQLFMQHITNTLQHITV
ncbi:LysR family transcriptional regulator [Paenibacillus agricola]|uniref:LysR family transcriptional regulator n=1 Tax=Paenibacillus agricola TaxID=2716264 RepID=A0ABX0JGQ3_9BACL|nr:LysR family transcriptional regulator [Paenibacillus agricola]NHN34077.1 LysR family transcriptional regulator [Paenibacillus agricola]